MESRVTEVISLFESYKAKNILLIGATGFLGKVLLAMTLSHLPMVGCIYILIRHKKNVSAEERFLQEILNSPAFQPLRDQYREHFNAYISSRVKVVEGDVTLPHLGIEPDVLKKLYATVNLVFNAAGMVDFFPDIRQAVLININGTLNVAEFTQHCCSASLIHVSTCYVAGKQNGIFEEKVELDKSPNGLMFDAEKEYSDLCHIMSIKNNPSRKKFIELGRERANHWGWNNTYVLTKALTEMLLVKRYPTLNKSIIRPSIIESSLHFPFPGWNEGLNTSAPIVKSLSGWYPCFVGKKNITLDLIPVDEVCNAMLLIASASLQNKASLVYQLATSNNNPCSMGLSVKMIRDWHRKNYRKSDSSFAGKYIRALLPIKCISMDHVLSPRNINNLISKTINKLDHYSYSWIKKLRKKLHVIKQELYKFEILYESYLPFCYEYSYSFVSDEINKLQPKESLFRYQPLAINWKKYWRDIHIPGVTRWVFSEKINDKKIANSNNSFIKIFFYQFCKAFFKWYCPLKVQGRENLPSAPYIIFSNHCSHLDTAVLMLATGDTFDNFYMIAAKDYFFDNKTRNVIVNKLMNIISIDRKPTQKSLKNTFDTCRAVAKDNKKNLIIYPEGTRSLTGDMQSFRSGIAMIATELGLPLVPVYINGTHKALNKSRYLPKPQKINVVIGQCIIPNVVASDKKSLFDYYRMLTQQLEISVRDLKGC